MGLGQTWQGTRLYPHKKDEAVIGKKRNGRLLYQPIIRRRRIASSEDIMVAVKSQLKNILYLTYISISNIIVQSCLIHHLQKLRQQCYTLDTSHLTGTSTFGQILAASAILIQWLVRAGFTETGKGVHTRIRRWIRAEILLWLDNSYQQFEVQRFLYLAV